ncbi:hypothetical protein FBUS_09080 [Fasciolopsis buskii]|uniref:Uncharacterized protein n=1 Tax=Fasciolopsis buskii TaxID=27845 RepID=A0A8E0RRH5_9TREM|nr:hypothetical protein FBUS_09080 [Fasciolopsis buski]
MTEENSELATEQSESNPLSEREQKDASPEESLQKTCKIRIRKKQKTDFEIIEFISDKLVKSFHQNKAESFHMLLFSEEDFRVNMRIAEKGKSLNQNDAIEEDSKVSVHCKMGPMLKRHYIMTLQRLNMQIALYRLFQSVIRTPGYDERGSN